MRHRLEVLTLAIVLASAAAVAASAQESPRVRVRTRPGMVVVADSIRLDTRHGRLGITVDMRPDASRDTVGALVAGITTPNSAAARAGVQVGDIVTRFNGTLLGAADDRGGDNEEEQSRPAMRLIKLASRLSAGDTVRLDLRRGTQTVNATLVAGESDVDMMVERMHMPGPDFGPMLGMPGMDGQMRAFIMGGPIADLELVKVNAGLGEYFGTQEGLLVVSVGQDTALGLRAGDVILSIGGRRPTSPPQAMRILGTYEPQETVQFEVMRQHHRLSVSGKIPQREEHGWGIHRDNLELQFDVPHPGHALIRFSGEV
ncbi:MAG: PDZ domain-containing protein [Gemmatimonadales bacterium]